MKTAKYALASLLLALLWTIPSFADSVTYNYQGPQFTEFFGTDSCTAGVGECSMTVSVTLAAPLADNLTGIAGKVTPTAFTISDGSNTIEQNSPNIFGTIFIFLTDNTGAITGWDIQVATIDGVSGAELGLDTNNSNLTTFFECSLFPQTYEEGSCEGTLSSGALGLATAAAGEFGSWTVQTPEPSTLALLLTSLLAIVMIIRLRNFC